MKNSGILKVEDDAIVFTPEILEQVGWKPGDLINITLNENETVTLEKA